MKQFSEQTLKGDLRTLVRISFPLFLFLFCEALTTFGERIFLSYHGVEAVSSSLNGCYLASIFQIPCVGVASMTQAFVGLYQGKGELKRIGPCIWQLIWFSLLSLIITLPLSLWSSSLYFKGTSIEQMGTSYFNILALGNFLFPLNIVLTSFYLGRGKTLLVTLLLLTSYAFNLGLCWTLVFGVKGFIPSLGIQGAALAKCLSMGLFCLIFFVLFLQRKNRTTYGTGMWQLSPTALWSYLRPGVMRAFGYFWIRCGWAVICYMMIKKGGLYLDIQIIGGTVIALFVFIFTGIYRSVLTIASHLLGGKNYSGLLQLFRSLIIYICMIGTLLAIPLLLYPQSLTYFFDSSSRQLFEKTFNTINHWIWFYSIAVTLQMGLMSFIVALQDLKLQFYIYLLNILTSLLPVYLFIQLWGWKADTLWIIMAFENVIHSLILFYSIRRKKWDRFMLRNEPI